MYSFYGGRPGNSFTIVASFPNVQTMVEQFKQGPAYTEVHYDEHVIINTEDKNNPTNGQIYRRGYDYNNDMGGAELIGTIVGPAGKAPLLTMDDYKTIDNMQGTEGLIDDENGHYISMKTKGQLAVPSEQNEASGLVPGKQGEEFNDTIKWVSYSFRDPQGKDTIAHVGFQIPYPVIDFETINTDFWESLEIERTDNKTHPFYEKWKITIPRGQKGDCIQNFRVITPTGNNVETDYKDSNEVADDINNSRQILVYDYYVYNDAQGNPIKNPIKKTLYIGDYNVIKSINLNDNGTLTVAYTHDSDSVFSQKIKWIDNIVLTEDGTLLLKYNTQENPTSLENKIKWIKDIYLQSNGVLTVKYNDNSTEQITTSSESADEDDPDSTQTDGIVLRWINSIQSSENGIITVHYNNGDAQIINEDDPLKFINSITLTNEGILQVKYNTSNTSENINNQNNPIKWISAININDNTATEDKGKLIVTYNNGSADKINMRYPTNIEIDETLDEEHPENQYKIKTTYSNGDINYSASPINYIKKMLVSSNGHLLAQYTDYNQNTGASTTINNVTQDWADLGIVSPEAFGFNNSTTTVTNKYLTGLLVPSEMKNNYEDLTFSINISQFLPKNLLSISITGCNITVYYSDNTSETILIDTDHFYITSDKNIIISSNLFGIDFIFTNFSNKSLSEKILVNILINSLDLAFDFDNSSEETQSETYDIRELTGRVSTLETKTGQLINTTVPAISQDVSAINQIIPKSSISSYSEENRTIISDLNNINTAIGDASEMNTVNTGGNTVVDSLKALNTPPINGGLLLNAWIVNLAKTSAVPTRLTNEVFDESKLNGPVIRIEGTNKGYELILIGNDILSNQPHGYVLQFSYLDGSKHKVRGDGHFQYYFVSKYIGSTANRSSIQIPLVMPDGSFASKKLYIKTHNAGSQYYSGVIGKPTTFIQGDFSFTTTARQNGLKFALTGVYGV